MRTKAGLQRRCGVGAVGKTSLKDMKVLIGQKGSPIGLCRRRMPVEWASDGVCRSANQKTGKESKK